MDFNRYLLVFTTLFHFELCVFLFSFIVSSPLSINVSKAKLNLKKKRTHIAPNKQTKEKKVCGIKEQKPCVVVEAKI